MGKNNEQYNQLMEKAVSSDNLVERATSNQRYAENDFNHWVSKLFEKLSFSSVLDVCCGTGNQLMLFASMPGISYIVGVDISKKSLNIAQKRLLEIKTDAHVILKPARMEEIFSDVDFKDYRFDLISCFYGLYYSQNVERLICEMIEHLSDEGSILIVGPYGNNNASLFSLLERHFDLPVLVKRSASTFMEKEGFSILAKPCVVYTDFLKNKIHYPNVKSIVDYWRSSTFYSPEYEDAVIKDMEEHFVDHDEFIVEKHIMACISKRRK